MRAGGIVLCGGRSARMGAPKAWLPVGAELMLPRVVRIVREATDAVVVVAAPGQAVPPLPPGVRVVRDEVEGRGPLGGLAAGLAALEGVAEVAYLSSCDVPLLTPAFVRRVLGALSEEPTPPPPPCREGEQSTRVPETSADCQGFISSSLQGGGRGVGSSVPFIDGRFHPLAAAYSLSVLSVVRERLAAGRLRMTDLLSHVPTRLIEAHELPDLDSLRNVNTPDEYAAALRELGAS